jgi:hypothetical protein
MSDDIEQVEVEAEAPEPTEAEAKARRQGWRPKDEYRGPEDKWVDAEAFLKRSDEELPIMRERLRRQDRELADLKSTVTKFAEHHAKVEKIAYERALAETKQKRREALAIGDADGFEAAEERLAELKEVKPAATQKEAAADIAPEVQTWVKANPWFQSEPRLAKYAETVCAELQTEDPTRDLSEILKEVTKEVKTRFPEKFANAKRAEPPAVEGTSSVAAGKGSKTYQALPPEAKKACDDFIRKGLIKSKDEYLKYYDWGN